jgi:endoplasmic reticulum-Golgi intermediate compartment protein 2
VSFIIFLLFCSEVSNYLYKEHAYDFVVDTKIGDDMQINVDMTVAMQCHCQYQGL